MKLIIAITMLLLFPVAASLLEAGALGQGSQTCPTSGAKQLSTTQIKVSWIILSTPSGNSGTISFGNSAITATTRVALPKSTIQPLYPLANVQPYDLSQIYIACSNSGDSITYAYLQ